MTHLHKFNSNLCFSIGIRQTDPENFLSFISDGELGDDDCVISDSKTTKTKDEAKKWFEDWKKERFVKGSA